jgi:hypothetical protein
MTVIGGAIYESQTESPVSMHAAAGATVNEETRLD